MSEQAVRVRSRRRNWAAPGSAHDRIIGAASRLLPMAIGVLAAFLVMAPLLMGGDVSFVLDKNKVEVAGERMRIRQARYRGDDARGQPFVLTAGSAVQKSSAEPIVRIDDLAAAIRLKDGPAELRAGQGRYDMESQQVMVDGPVHFSAADGYSLDTSDATLDLKQRTLKSGGDSVKGTLAMGRFQADSLEADLDDRTVTLTGDARLHVVPGRAKGRR